MAKQVHTTAPVVARRRVAAPRTGGTPRRRSPACPAITIRLGTRGDLARLIDRLINMLDGTENTDEDWCAEDMVSMPWLTLGVTGPGDAEDAECADPAECGGDPEPDALDDMEENGDREPAAEDEASGDEQGNHWPAAWGPSQGIGQIWRTL